MTHIRDFRNADRARRVSSRIADRLADYSGEPLRFMEFCGGHTHAILRYGIRQMLPAGVALLSGPGCPVCVTANRDLDYAMLLSQQPGVILATFGDMIRVPGSHGSLQEAKAEGGDVRIVYSTLDALQMARDNPDQAVVFLGIGFETTAPTVATSLLQAQQEGLENYYVYSAHKLTPPATRAILDAGEVSLKGILGPGHVTTINGLDAWRFVPQSYRLPVVIAGFEPLDLLGAIDTLVEMALREEPSVANAYTRSVRQEGNVVAQRVMDSVFQVADADWRGLGTVPDSGLLLQPSFAAHDARLAFPLDPGPPREHPGCRCGDVLRGTMWPTECPLYAQACTPAHPVGPCMVSAEGACAAYYQYGER
jgi:hydrogenase expression/formation protein HypD